MFFLLAAKAAKEATFIATNTILPVSFSSSIQLITEMTRDDPPTHKRAAKVYQHQKASRDSKQIKNRKDDVLLARLQSGHHPSLHHYIHRLDPTQDPIFPSWRLSEQDLNHLICECPTREAIMQQMFGNHKGSLEWLATRPRDVVAYVRKTLVNVDA